MRDFETKYLDLVSKVLAKGELRKTRAGPTHQLFGTKLRIKCLEDGEFPLLLTRRMYPSGILGELAAFIRGAETLKEFKIWGCNYWDANAASYGDGTRVGKIYGSKWRDFHGVDQLRELVAGIKLNPSSRRHLLTTYDPSETDHCLPPCHLLAQFNVTGGNLECIVYMRSVDLILGLPSDIALYAALLILIAKETGLQSSWLTFMMGDTHVYSNHVEQFMNDQQWRKVGGHPTYELDEDADLFNFVPDQLEIVGYNPYAPIKYTFNP